MGPTMRPIVPGILLDLDFLQLLYDLLNVYLILGQFRE